MKPSSILCLLVAITLLAAGCSGDGGENISASGTIEGTDVNVGVEAGGRIREIRVGEGTLVSAGDTLLLIDDREYRIQLRQAVATMESYAAAYNLALEGSRKEDIVQAEAAFKTAEADYRRMEDLLATQTITRRQYDETYTRYVAAQQTFEKLRQGLRPEEVSAARARKESAEAQMDLLRKKLQDCVLLSPSRGIVTLRAVEPGELVSPGARVMRITNLDRVNLMIYVREADLGRVKLGQETSVYIDAAEGRAFPGRVVYISPNAEFTPKNVQTKEERTKLVFGVKIEIDNPDGVLKPGLPADAVIITGTESGR